MARIYRVGFARAEVDTSFGWRVDISYALQESWWAGMEVTRYGRTWILSRLDFLRPDVAFARIGFVREGEARTLRFDREREVFVRESASSVVVPVAMNTSTGLMAVQLSPEVRVRSVTGAVQSALNAPPMVYSWTISEFAQRVPYQSWIHSVERVTDFRFRIERPNPRWPEEGVAKALLDAMRLEVRGGARRWPPDRHLRRARVSCVEPGSGPL